jgi:2-methylcitrate dehydratase PrpD
MQTRHALGTAEYHGPRGPMMRCIDHPTMVKDGSAQGAADGVSAVLLAVGGFSGAPAHMLTDTRASGLWADLGDRWYITEQYFKPFPVCRWAHPAVQAALELREVSARHEVTPAGIDHVEVVTFHAAARLGTRHPTTTEEAQYSLPFSVATALVHGAITPAHLATPRRTHPDVARLSATMELRESTEYSRRFPAQRHAHAELVLRDGTRHQVGTTTAPGGPDRPLSDRQLATKYRTLTDGVLTRQHATTLEDAIHRLRAGGTSQTLIDNLLSPPASGCPESRPTQHGDSVAKA